MALENIDLTDMDTSAAHWTPDAVASLCTAVG